MVKVNNKQNSTKGTSTILVIDDDQHSLILLRDMLMQENYRLRLATDGTSALKSIYSDPPDLILVDVMMPDFDGFEICEELKSTDHTSNIPVIFVSAKDDVTNKVKAFTIGGVDYITKPFEAEEVIARVKTHLELRRLVNQLAHEIDERIHIQIALQEARDELEVRIQERTQELTKANAELIRETAELNRVEQALRESEARYRNVVETQTELVVRNRPDGIRTFVNQAFCRYWGFPPEEAIGKSFFDLISADQRALVEGKYASLTVDNPTATHIEQIINPDGYLTWQEWTETGIFDQSGNLIEIQAIGRDITERKRTDHVRQARLRLSEYAINHSVDNVLKKSMDEAKFITFSPNAVFYFWNDHDKLLTSEACLDNNFVLRSSKQPFQYPIGKAVLLQCIKEQRPIIFNNRSHTEELIDSNSTITHLLAVPIIRNQSVTAILGVANKSTDYHEIDAEMLQQFGDASWEILRRKQIESDLEEVQELLELKNRFISIVSHEFRTPLAVIQTSVDMLLRYDTKMSTEEKQKKLDKITQQVYILSEMIDDVLSLSHVQSQNANFNPTLVDIETFSREIFEHIQFIDGAKHRFDFVSKLSNKLMLIDGKLFQYVLSNLLTNAIKYSPCGTRITLVLDQDDNTRIIKIIDEGIGIPEGDIEQLFEPFRRAKNADQYKGTGLGLSIAKEYIALHGGTIQVESKLGKGTTFTVRL